MASRKKVEEIVQKPAQAGFARGKNNRAGSDELRKRIQDAAYYRYLNRGAQSGNDQQDWFEAEKEVRNALS